MKKIIIPIIALIGMCINLNAQEKSNKEKQGDKYMFNYSFDKAIESYSNAKLLTVEGQRHLAESYNKLNNTVKAEEEYVKLMAFTIGVVPEDNFNYAMVLKANGKYEQANAEMDIFNALKPDDLRAKDYIVNKSVISDWLKKDVKNEVVSNSNRLKPSTETLIEPVETVFLNNKSKVVVKHLDFNTEAKDFGVCYYKNNIVFASSRSSATMFVKKYNWTEKPFENIYISEMENGQLQSPKEFDKKFNGKLHDGPVSFNKEGTYMALTRNNYHDRTTDRVVELKIYFSNLVDGKWSKPEPFILNNNVYSVGQPSLSADGNTMYFASDMTGGFGGADLYRITKNETGVWGNPENLGNRINTEGDELYPFFEEKSENFFFTSNGRSGFGGLDIFNCESNGFVFGDVHNVGSSVNTQYDDFAFVINDSLSKGYFSSNKPGGSGDDDIYSFDVKAVAINKQIVGIAMDKNRVGIPYTFITLQNADGTIIDTVTTKEDASFIFLVETDKNFKLNGKQSNYTDGDTVTNTFGKEYIVTADIVLLKMEKKNPKKIVVGADLAKVLVFDPKTIYFDYGKYNIRPDAIADLKMIIKTMNENPTMVVELSSYTDCRSSYAYNQILSENRAKASVNYIKKRITNPKRIYGKGYGEKQLVNGCACEDKVVSDCLEEIHQMNRRTEFIIKKN